ncbi:hypothetical protein PMAYCL1PPCAC_17118, partial [Pristionchus mayeri]
ANSAMPAKGASKKIDRNCLVCGETTQIAHLGIDTCRACAVFYRRAKRGNDFVCRSSTGRCPTGKGLNCKRCRFDRLRRLLKDAEPPEASQKPSTSQSSKDSTTESSSSTKSSPRPTNRSDQPILERLKAHYRTMCFSRLNGELNAREDPPHPLEISLEKGPFYPATISSLAIANRILLTALLEFASSVFPEFGQLENKEKWDIIVNNFYRFRIFEGCYRAGLVFPDDLNKTFGGFTTWMSRENLEYFYSEAEGEAKEKAMQLIRFGSMRMQEIPAAREFLRKINLRHEEFLVLIAIMFWTIGDMPVREEITLLGDRYRETILKELHAFYREQIGLDDYAARLGELMMLLPTFDRSHEMKEHFEMLRLLDVLPEDSFTYQLQKAD